jgi:hypothetical protein
MPAMDVPDITQKLLAAKQAKGISFAYLEQLLGRDEVWIAALFYRQASASEEEASTLVGALGLGADGGTNDDADEGIRPSCSYRSANLSLLRNHAGLWYAD